jgi:hypothetical protein
MDRAGEPQRTAFGIALGRGARAHPQPAAVFLQQAILDVVGRALLQMLAHGLADDGAVVGMDERLELAVGRAFVLVVAEHLSIAGRMPDLAGEQVELEQGVLRA